MIIVIGEILFDIFPNYRRIGGAPFNFAYHLNRLGETVRFFTRIGNDPEGQEILTMLDRSGINRSTVQIDHHYPTGRVQVELDQKGIPEFSIITDAAYDHIDFNAAMATTRVSDARLIYFGTLIQRTPNGFNVLRKINELKGHQTKFLCDINLRPNCYSDTVIVESLKQTDILKLSRDELKLIKERLKIDQDDTEAARTLINTYAIEMISLTKGSAGSEIITADECCRISPQKIDHITDTVGAGDAYAAVLAYGYLHSWPLDRILSKASEFAAEICKIEGAVPLTKRLQPLYDHIQSN